MFIVAASTEMLGISTRVVVEVTYIYTKTDRSHDDYVKFNCMFPGCFRVFTVSLIMRVIWMSNLPLTIFVFNTSKI